MEHPIRPRPKRAFAAMALAAAVLAPLAGCARKTDTAQAAADTPRNVTLTAAQRQHIHVYTVTAAQFRRTIEASGVVDFDNDQATSVLAPISGPVTRLLVQPGQLVRAGQVLATVNSPDYAAAVDGYRKALVVARNARRLAEVDKDLAQHNGVSQRELEQAQTDAAGAEADRDAALRALTALNAGPGASPQGQIRAPISGTVVEKLITPGQLLQAGTTPAFTIANLSRIWVMAQLTPADLAAVRVGDRAEVETGVGANVVAGVVDNISALVNADTRAIGARVVVANPGGVLKKQMYVRVRIQARQPEVGLTAPVSAILRDDENLPFVYVALPDGAFARRHVTLGERTGDQFAISEGLAPGDRIVSDGALFMQFMQSQ